MTPSTFGDYTLRVLSMCAALTL